MYMVKEYVRGSKFQYRDALYTVKEFGKELLQMKGMCMDIGCGPGDVTRKLILPRLAPGTRVVGSDISNAMIDYAREAHRDEERLSFIQLDIETDALPKDQLGQYDNVLSFYCLHWCRNVRQAFTNIHNLLKPGGKALIMFLGYNDGFDAYERLFKEPQYKAYRQYVEDAERFVPYFQRCEDSGAALKTILEDVGFDVLHCSRRERTYIHQNIQCFREHILPVNPFMPRVPEHLKEEFGDIVVREIMSKKIQFLNKLDNGQVEHSILDRYQILVAFAGKPLPIC